MRFAILFSLAVAALSPVAAHAADSPATVNPDASHISANTASLRSKLSGVPNLFAPGRNTNRTAPLITSANPVAIECLGGALWTGVMHVAVQDTLAYCSMVEGLTILNIADPSAPKRVAQIYIPGTGKRSVQLRGNFEYLAGGFGGLRIVDVSDPTHPVIVGTYDTPYSATHVELVGDYALVSDFGPLVIVDVSNPYAPFRVAEGSPPISRSYESAVHGDFLFVAGGPDGLHVVDISDPTSPVRVQTLALSPTEHVAVEGDTLYAQNHTSNVFRWDISTPAAPATLPTISVTTVPFHMTVSGGFYYATDADKRLTICDLINPPVFSWENVIWDSLDNALGFSLVDTLIYVANGFGGLKILSNADPSSMPFVVGTWDTPDFSKEISRAGALALVIDNYWLPTNRYSLHLIDVSDPSSPESLSTYQTPGVITDAEGMEPYVFVSTNVSGLHVLDASDPQSPVLVHQVDSLFAGDLAVKDSLLYAASAQGLSIFNVSDPLAPSLVGSVGGFGIASLVKVSGAYALLVTSGTGLQVVDVSDPSAPVALGSTPASGVVDIAIESAYAYATNTASLLVIDISDPSAPVQVTSLPAHDRAKGLDVRGNYAYVTDQSLSDVDESGLWIYDISNPAAPIVAGFFETPGQAWDVALSGNNVLVADFNGLLSLSTDLSTGDVNLDGKMSAADLVWLVNYLYKSGPDPLPNLYQGDVDCSGTVDLLDLINLCNHIFRAGPSPC